jgi:hypothetical protein
MDYPKFEYESVVESGAVLEEDAELAYPPGRRFKDDYIPSDSKLGRSGGTNPMEFAAGKGC